MSRSESQHCFILLFVCFLRFFIFLLLLSSLLSFSSRSTVSLWLPSSSSSSSSLFLSLRASCVVFLRTNSCPSHPSRTLTDCTLLGRRKRKAGERRWSSALSWTATMWIWGFFACIFYCKWKAKRVAQHQQGWRCSRWLWWWWWRGWWREAWQH